MTTSPPNRGRGYGTTRLRELARETADAFKTTVREALDDDLAGEAAKIAYFFFLSTAIGAVVATVGGIVATVLFGLYVTNLGQYGRTYGAVGAIIVLMIWFYITGFAVLFGGELAAVLEQRRRERRRGRAVDAGGVNAQSAAGSAIND